MAKKKTKKTSTGRSEKNWRQVWLIDSGLPYDEYERLKDWIEVLAGDHGTPDFVPTGELAEAVKDGKVTRIEMQKPTEEATATVTRVGNGNDEKFELTVDGGPGGAVHFNLTELVERVSNLESAFVDTVSQVASIKENVVDHAVSIAVLKKVLAQATQKLIAIDKWVGYSNPDTAEVDKQEAGVSND